MGIFSQSQSATPHYWRNFFTRLTITAITSLLIVWFMPRNEAKQLNVEVGEPWTYPTVIAKFDIPIYKTEAEQQAERDSLLATFQPYYVFDSAVEDTVMAMLKKAFATSATPLSASAQATVIDRLHDMYKEGVMETADYNRLRKDTSSQVRVIVGKGVESVHLTTLYSTMGAYQSLMADERLAAELAPLKQLNLTNYIEPNLIYDRERSETARNDLLSGVSAASGMVLDGQKIIGQGDMVTENNIRMVRSWQRAMQERSAGKAQMTYNICGNALYVFLLVALFTWYLGLFRRDYFTRPRSVVMLYALIALFPILTSLMMQHNYFSFSVYVLPFALVPIFVRVFMDSRTAFLTHFTTVMISAAALRYQFDFIAVQTVAGLMAIYSLRGMSSRSQVFRTAAWVFVAMSLTFFALKLMEAGEDFVFDPSLYYHFIICGVLLLLAYPLMFLMEKLFGFTSVITLIEISDTNKGLLRRLSEVAPGTFQHSITVGNLASEIANRIGGNATLVRTGALYHDIGKIKNPAFFTENQQGGVNPHDNLTERESAQIIISHVTNGVKLAEEAGLPAVIRDFILTHHGRGLVKYFYIKAQNAHPDEVIDKEPFTYPGPNPSTREQAILMMADTCEAASHSLKEYTNESITKMVDTLVDQQVKDGFFNECRITFYDIAVAKQVMVERLKAIYHTRIQYPKAVTVKR